MWVPVPPSAEAALAGATVLVNISGSPITVGRAEDRRLLVRSASDALPGRLRVRRRRVRRVEHRPVVGRPDPGLRAGRAARRDRAVRRRAAPHGGRRRPAAAPPGAAAAGHLRRQPPHARRAGCSAVPHTSTSTLAPPTGDIGLRRHVDRFPFVPDDPERLALDCYEAYNIQVSGLEQRLRAIGNPKVVIGVSGGLDSTHALIVAAKAMDRLGRPRTDIHAFTMPGFATSAGTKDNATRLSQALGVTFEEIDIRPGRHADARGPRPPVRRGRADVRRDVRERAGGAAHRLPVPDREPSRRHRARHRRPVRARARLVHLRRRRPDVALRRQRRRPEDPDPAPDPLGGRHRPARARRRRGAAGDPRPGDLARSWSRSPRESGRRAPRTRSGPTRCRTSRSSTCCATASRPAGSRSWPSTPGPTSDRGEWPPGFDDGPPHGVRPGHHPAAGSRSSCSGSSRSASSSGPRCPTGPRSWPAARSRRAGTGGRPSDGNARVWLDELHRNVPEA